MTEGADNQSGQAVHAVFDLLLSGDDLRRQPLIERKKALRGYFADREAAFPALTFVATVKVDC